MRMSATVVKVRELRAQIRADILEGRRPASVSVEDVPPGAILIATPHRATVVAVAEIAEVSAIAANSLGLRGCVTLHDGTRLFVPDAHAVIAAINTTSMSRRGRSGR
jgi:hypothetical protein